MQADPQRPPQVWASGWPGRVRGLDDGVGCGRDGSRSLELQKSVLASTAAVGACTMPRGARSGAHAARPAAAQSSGAFCGSP